MPHSREWCAGRLEAAKSGRRLGFEVPALARGETRKDEAPGCALNTPRATCGGEFRPALRDGTGGGCANPGFRCASPSTPATKTCRWGPRPWAIFAFSLREKGRAVSECRTQESCAQGCLSRRKAEGGWDLRFPPLREEKRARMRHPALDSPAPTHRSRVPGVPTRGCFQHRPPGEPG
jgi:hypothetical protein